MSAYGKSQIKRKIISLLVIGAVFANIGCYTKAVSDINIISNNETINLNSDEEQIENSNKEVLQEKNSTESICNEEGILDYVQGAYEGFYDMIGDGIDELIIEVYSEYMCLDESRLYVYWIDNNKTVEKLLETYRGQLYVTDSGICFGMFQ